MDFFAKFRPGEIIAVIAITGGVLVAVVAIVSGVWYAAVRNRQDATLRKDMLDRGMSAAEIEQAMRGFAQPASDDRYQAQVSSWYDAELAKYLASAGAAYSPQAIEFVLGVIRGVPSREKEAVYNAIQGMIDEEAREEQLVAAVRALCRQPEATPQLPTDSRAFAAKLPLEMRG